MASNAATPAHPKQWVLLTTLSLLSSLSSFFNIGHSKNLGNGADLWEAFFFKPRGRFYSETSLTPPTRSNDPSPYSLPGTHTTTNYSWPRDVSHHHHRKHRAILRQQAAMPRWAPPIHPPVYVEVFLSHVQGQKTICFKRRMLVKFHLKVMKCSYLGRNTLSTT